MLAHQSTAGAVDVMRPFKENKQSRNNRGANSSNNSHPMGCITTTTTTVSSSPVICLKASNERQRPKRLSTAAVSQSVGVFKSLPSSSFAPLLSPAPSNAPATMLAHGFSAAALIFGDAGAGPSNASNANNVVIGVGGVVGKTMKMRPKCLPPSNTTSTTSSSLSSASTSASASGFASASSKPSKHLKRCYSSKDSLRLKRKKKRLPKGASSSEEGVVIATAASRP